jgi:hypothetical protein
MRPPSDFAFKNRVDIYPAISGQDTAGSYVPTYASIPSQSQRPCSVQQQDVEEIIEVQGQDFGGGQQRLTRVRNYKVIFGFPDPRVRPRDRLVWIDDSGITRFLIVQVTEDNAGRGAVFTVYATERI